MEFKEIERHRIVEALIEYGKRHASPPLTREVAELIVKIQEPAPARASLPPAGFRSLYPYRFGQLEGLVESYLMGLIKDKRAFKREFDALLAKYKEEDAAPDPAAVASGPAPRRCGCEIQLDRRCEHER